MDVFKPEDRANFLIQEYFLNGKTVNIDRLINLKYEMDNSVVSAMIATKEALIAINTIYELVKNYKRSKEIFDMIVKINTYYLKVYEILENEANNGETTYANN